MPFLESHNVYCPYCSQSIEIAVDYSVNHQEYVEDCQVCCRPIMLRVSIFDDNEVDIQAFQENE